MLLLRFLKSHVILLMLLLFTIITDGLDAYNIPILLAYPKSKHHRYHSFAEECSNNILESFNKTFKLGIKRKKDFIVLILL